MESSIRYFMRTAERLDSNNLQLQHHQSTLLQRFNDLHSATRSLPPSVLAQVFRYVCRDTRLYEDMLVNYPAVQIISRVCSQWRQVACTSPVLWTRVLLRFKEPGSWVSNNSLSMLELHLVNSGEFALDILLDIPDKHYSLCQREEGPNWESHYTAFTTIFYLIFIENATKLGSLVLTRSGGMPKIWLQLIQSYTTYPLVPDALATSGYPNLTKLEFRTHAGWVASQQDEAEVHRLFKDTPVPRLASVSARNYEWSIRFPYKDLTSLRLDSFPVNRCVDFLINCPRLTSFYQPSCIEVMPSGVDPPQCDSGSLVVLSNLEHLEWSFGFREWDVYLMRQFRFPSLSTLCARQQPRSPTSGIEVHWTSFLASLVKLEKFSFDTELLSMATFGPVWDALSHLNCLASVCVSTSGSPTAADQAKSIIEPLTVTPDDPDRPVVLSHLTTLMMELNHIECLEENAEIFLRLLESRAQSSRVSSIKFIEFHSHPFPRFSEDNPVWTTWSDEQRRRLDKLTSDGLKFTLTKNGMSWIYED